MSFDPERLMNYDIPEVRQSWGPEDCSRYALSLGMSQDPLDVAQLAFTAGVGGWQALPMMGLILGHPGFWMGNPDTGIDAVRLVHGQEALEIANPLPPEGEVIGKTRVIGIEDKGADKGALVYSEKLLTDAQTGQLYARIIRTTFLRGNGGFGGALGIKPDPLDAPDGEPDHIAQIATRPEQALLYRWNGDDNPLHFDPAVAAKAGFERPILHGLCTLGIAGQIALGRLTRWHAAKMRGLSGRFTASVYPGETLAVELWNDGAFRVRVIDRDVIAINSGKIRIG